MNHSPSIAVFAQPPLSDPGFVAAIISHARRLSLCVEIPGDISRALPEELRTDLIIREYPSSDCRMVLSLGGDGTFLRAARRSLYGSGAPVAGINTGTLGFLATWEREDFPRLLEMAATYRIPVRERTLLSLNLPGLPGFEPRLALNDISILRSQSSQMITVSATLGNSPLTDYTGDGLIVCTATGSTGYNLSAGGPILQPDTDALVLTPVAPHTFTQRPLVISGNEPLHLNVSGRSPGFLVSTDGVSEEFACGTRLQISRSPRRLRVVHNASEDFAARLRAKLMWGENPVTR